MKSLPIRLPALLLALNWAVFIGVFAWTSAVQHSLLWWLRLDWAGGLARFGAMARLGLLPAGSVWILWLLLSVLSTAVCVWRAAMRRKADALPGDDQPQDTRDSSSQPTEGMQWHLATDDPVLTAHYGLGEKIERLQKSLDRI